MRNTENIEQLSAAFIVFTKALLDVEKAIRNDPEHGYQSFVPVNADTVNEYPRELAIKSIRRVRVDPDLVVTGLLCASPKTLKAIEKLNDAKEQFQSAVMLIKGKSHTSSKMLQKLMGLDQSKKRDDGLATALRAIGGQSFDLRSCYAKLQVLPKDTSSVSWTWAMKHKRIKKYSLDDAFKLSERLTNEKAKQAATIQLNRVPANETLIQKLDMPPQLKANIKYWDKGRELKKNITVSGILIVQGKTLPEYLFREKPETAQQRLSRTRTIEDKLFVPTLKMYRYANHN